MLVTNHGKRKWNGAKLAVETTQPDNGLPPKAMLSNIDRDGSAEPTDGK